MKRRQFLKHLEAYGCEIYAEGAKHSKCKNLATGKKTTIPRHAEIDNDLARDICGQLGVAKIR